MTSTLLNPVVNSNSVHVLLNLSATSDRADHSVLLNNLLHLNSGHNIPRISSCRSGCFFSVSLAGNAFYSLFHQAQAWALSPHPLHIICTVTMFTFVSSGCTFSHLLDTSIQITNRHLKQNERLIFLPVLQMCSSDDLSPCLVTVSPFS